MEKQRMIEIINASELVSEARRKLYRDVTVKSADQQISCMVETLAGKLSEEEEEAWDEQWLKMQKGDAD